MLMRETIANLKERGLLGLHRCFICDHGPNGPLLSKEGEEWDESEGPLACEMKQDWDTMGRP